VSDPSASVVIPCYNHAEYVGAAIESVLGQSLAADEVVVVDDASGDGSRDVVKGFRARGVRLLEQEHGGAHSAITRGVDESNGDLIFVLNSDDRFAPSRIRTFHERFAADPELAFAGSWIRVIDVQGRSLGVKRGWQNMEPWPLAASRETFQGTPDARLNLLQTNYLSTSSNFVFRRSTWNAHRPLRALRFAHDWEFALRVARTDKVELVPQPLLEYRVHAHNTIRQDRRAMEFEILWVLAANIAGYLQAGERPPEAGSRLNFLKRLFASVQTFGHDRTFWLLVALAGSAGDDLGGLLEPDSPVRRWLMGTME
jgi:glycosyltransferase involved in cell wall biosynthesis